MFNLSKTSANSMLIIICLVISTGCLAAGYVLVGYWQTFLIFPLLLILWLLTYKQSSYLSASTCLIGYVILAAVGILLDIPISLMVIACVIALAGWELMLFSQSNKGNLPDNSDVLRKRYHLNSLALTVSAGLTLALISANISLRIPFVVIVSLVLLFVGCLVYAVQNVVKKKY